jgi:hypothetical protein
MAAIQIRQAAQTSPRDAGVTNARAMNTSGFGAA